MSRILSCPSCARAHPAPDGAYDPHYCSIACFQAGEQSVTGSEPPSCHDSVTMTCPVCSRAFDNSGRKTYCSDGCKAAAYRRRRDSSRPAVVVPAPRPRRPVTVYECDSCGTRALGEQRCESCGLFMGRVGIGGCCPACEAPVAVTELLGEKVSP